MTQKHEINFGDLVYVDGYGNRPFFVDGWSEESIYTIDGQFDETWFDVTCAHTGEYHMAELSDVKLVCRAEQAESFLKYNRWEGEGVFFWMPDDDDIKKYIQPLREKLNDKKSKKQHIDDLLDEYNDIKRIIDEFGDDEENDYKAKINEIERKIKAVSSE